MEWVGYEQVNVSAIKLPGDIKARQKLPHVIELAESIDEFGGEPIHAPTIRAKSNTLIAGRDRMAALLLKGTKRCWVRVAKCTDAEASDLEVVENLRRRHDDRDALIARLVKRRTAQLTDTPHDNSKPGRPKTATGAARERVARELGTTTEAIRAAEHRAAVAEAPEDDEPEVRAPSVETWGIGPGYFAEGELAAVQGVQEDMDAADRALRAAQAALTRVEGRGIVGKRLALRIQADVHLAADTVRRSRPAAVCPWCKGIEALTSQCSGCDGIGYVGKAALEAIEPALLKKGDEAVVAVRGRLTPIATARAQGAPVVKAPPMKPQPKPAAKKLRIEDEKGSEIVPDLDDDEAF